MTYFKLSSWKISTWLPPARQRQGRLCQRGRAGLPKPAEHSKNLPGSPKT